MRAMPRAALPAHLSVTAQPDKSKLTRHPPSARALDAAPSKAAAPSSARGLPLSESCLRPRSGAGSPSDEALARDATGLRDAADTAELREMAPHGPISHLSATSTLREHELAARHSPKNAAPSSPSALSLILNWSSPRLAAETGRTGCAALNLTSWARGCSPDADSPMEDKSSARSECSVRSDRWNEVQPALPRATRVRRKVDRLVCARIADITSLPSKRGACESHRSSCLSSCAGRLSASRSARTRAEAAKSERTDWRTTCPRAPAGAALGLRARWREATRALAAI